jgi:hypothetical protein
MPTLLYLHIIAGTNHLSKPVLTNLVKIITMKKVTCVKTILKESGLFKSPKNVH